MGKRKNFTRVSCIALCNALNHAAMHTTNPPLSTAEAAERAGIDRSTLTRWVASGRITPAFRTPGGALFFHAADIDEAAAQS